MLSNLPDNVRENDPRAPWNEYDTVCAACEAEITVGPLDRMCPECGEEFFDPGEPDYDEDDYYDDYDYDRAADRYADQIMGDR